MRKIDAKIAAVLAAAMLALPALAVTEGRIPLVGGSGKPYLEQQVRRELNRLPYLGVFDHLTFSVAGDTVTLRGQTIRPTLKRDAENVVKRIEGVRAVNNQVEVLPLSNFDNDLRIRAFWAVYGSQALNRYLIQPQLPVHIIVKNGNITLEGVVNNELERQVAYSRVRGLPGSFQVVNHLRLDHGED
jgi:hyperosmotically inducible protein